MKIIEPPVKLFMPEFERYEPAVQDSSAMSTFKRCKRLYFYRYVLGFIIPKVPIYYAFGTAIHKFWELYTTDYNFDAAVAAAVESWRLSKAIPSLGDKFDFLTLERLILTCKEAKNTIDVDKRQGAMTIIAREQIIEVVIPGTDIRIGGRADQLLNWGGKIWGGDIKTTSKQIELWKRGIEPNDQFTRYTYMECLLTGGVVSGQMVTVIHNSKKLGPIIQRVPTTRTQAQLAQWAKEQIHYNDFLKLCRERDIWPMDDDTAPSSPCKFCDYRIVCSSSNEADMVTKLKAGYKQSPWDFARTETTPAESE